jgi:hypothetical protein
VSFIRLANYCWKSHFRTICRLAAELHADPERRADAYWLSAGPAEREFIRALANAPTEVFFLWMAANAGD